MMRGRTRWLAAISLAATIVAACAGPSGPATSSDPGAKAGGRSGPIAITVADSQPSGKPSNLPLAEFKRQVEKLSGGAMTVTILTDASPDADPPGSDGPVIDKVKSGVFQMAVIPARAWSAAGVTSLKALQAPFLFDSDEHVAATVNDPAITADLFSGLDGSGVTGLTLFPESLRHLFSFGRPMLAPADVKGRTIRAISSQETTATIEALGGTAVDPDDDAYQQGIADGTIQGTDSGFVLSAGLGPNRTSTATGNVALYAKVMTLVINSALWTGLDDTQRAIISSASDATRTWAIANQVNDADAAATFCAGGGTVVLADAASIAAFRAAEAPVDAALKADPATRRTIAAIRAHATGTSASTVNACEPVIDAANLVPGGGDLPNGIYRIEYTDAYLKSWGVSDVNLQHGIYTYRLKDGHWTIDTVADEGPDHDVGIYQVKGLDLYWRWDREQRVDHLKWSVADNGDLIFAPAPGTPAISRDTVKVGTSEGWIFGLPLIRIGAVD
jgi:TRAP-type C4-dicarboxylate transport system substrate-binding protein